VWGSNAPRRKSVSPAGSTRTKRNLLWVTPAVILQPASGTRSTFTSCCPHPPYTFTSCGSHPPYCCFVQVIPAALSCPTATDAHSKLLPLAGRAANLNTAVYDFMTNSRCLRRTSMRTVHGIQFEYIHPMRRSNHVISNHQSKKLNHTHASRHSNDTDADS
jgi:hypothetical protein